MTATADLTIIESLIDQTMKLSALDREIFLNRLHDRFHEEEEAVSDELSDDMKATLDRRWEEIVTGKVKCRDGFEVLAEIREMYGV